MWEQAELDDSLAGYAKKMLPQIDLNQPVVLIGLSFGGLLAVELSKLIDHCQTIVISSAVRSSYFPKKYKLFGTRRSIYKVPFSIIRKANFIANYFFGVKEKEHKALLKEILLNSDEFFFKWGLNSIFLWENDYIPPDLTIIHGTNDKIFPNMEPNAIAIEGGGHFMVLDKAKLISNVLSRILKD